MCPSIQLSVLVLVFAVVPLAAQQPTRPDTARRDTVRRDSTPFSDPAPPQRLSDTAATDTVDVDSVRPVLPALTPPGPFSRNGRWVFDEDALVYLGALDLAELLAHVPGTFVVRGGWFGQSSAISYAGQGAASVELYWDGYRLDPLGADSAAIDLGRISLGLVRRVEVEVLPTVLRVYFVSDTQPFRRALTEASFATGDATTNTYLIRYLNRWRSGAGLGLGVNWFGTDGPPTSAGSVADLTLWAKGTWTPSPLVGVELQLLSYAAKHDSLLINGAAGTGIPGANDTRRDLFVRGYFGSRADGLGLRFDALLGGTTYRDSVGTERALSQAAATASYRLTNASAEVSARIRDALTPLELGVRGAWSPGPWLALSGFARSQQHGGARSSTELGGAAELRAGPFALHGAFRWRDAVARPDFAADTAQQVSDWSSGVSYAGRRLWLDVSFSRHGYFEAPAWDVFRRQLPRLTAIDVTTLTTAFRVRPRDWLTLSGWYRHPLDPLLASYEPPHHTRVALTFRSRMLPRYRRGVFDMVIEASLEGWSDGVAGRDGTGIEIRLLGATSYNYLFEMRLVGAVLFWTMRNVGVERYALIPGIEQARALQRFGVKWEFTN
jgi:hypothetical protein